jgi:hypothetical protein
VWLRQSSRFQQDKPEAASPVASCLSRKEWALFAPDAAPRVALWISCRVNHTKSHGVRGALDATSASEVTGTERALRGPMRRVVVGAGLAVMIAGAMIACSAARLPAPPYVQQPTAALARADYPPPPARVEYIPTIPSAKAVWLDGEWTWQGTRWAWKPGRWVLPPENAKFSPWTGTRDQQGNFYVAEGKWRGPDGGDVADPKPLAIARTRGGSVTDPEGEAIASPPNVPANAPPGKPGTPGAGDGGRPETPSGATLTGTEAKSGTVVDSGPPPLDAAIPDAGLPDALEHDAMPLGAKAGAREQPSRESSPRMGMQ